MNFMVNAAPEQVRERCRNMLKRAEGRGGYALGTGNSVPEYIPVENYLAMASTVLK
jgi:uroporphyrinogen decarboxylase